MVSPFFTFTDPFLRPAPSRPNHDRAPPHPQLDGLLVPRPPILPRGRVLPGRERAAERGVEAAVRDGGGAGSTEGFAVRFAAAVSSRLFEQVSVEVPQASSPESPSPKAKAPRSVSPGGTAASSAGAALRSSARSSSEGTKAPRRVSWADSLVASVRTRPRTPRKDVASLFYSRADERRFRREAEEALPDDEWCEQLEDDSLASLSDEEEDELPPPPAQPKEEESHGGLWSPTRERKDYAISKAVVVFGDSTRTYGATVGCCAVEAALGAQAEAAFSFDDAAFWNGQLTWS